MNRIFHVRITWYQYLHLILLGGLAFFLLWDKNIALAAVCMILLIRLIERFIYTTYTITTDGQLILSTGRFSKPKTVWVKDIVSVERRTSVKIGRFAILRYILIGSNNGGYMSVLPIKEQEFIDLLDKRRSEFQI